MLSKTAVVIGICNLSVLGMSIVHRRTDPSLLMDIPKEIVPQIELNFADAEIIQNNLGGLGPDSGAKWILYQNVAQQDGRMINLKIENTSTYSGNISKNILTGDFAQINVDPDMSVKLELTLLDAETGDIVVAPRFSISFWDFDQGKEESGTESLEIGPVETYFASEDTELIAKETNARNMWKFTATERGKVSDNPESLSSLTDLQLSRAVEVEMVMQPRTYLTFGVTPNEFGSFGRNFLMAGPSELRSKKSHAVGYCSKALAMSFATSTGSLAEGDALRISNFVQQGGDSVDLAVTADAEYAAANASRNGVVGGLLNLNVKGNLTTTFTLSFFKSSTDEAVELKDFFLTILDVDAPKNGFEEVAVKSPAFDHYVLGTNSHLQVATSNEMTTFRSSTIGYLQNNPTSSDGLLLSTDDRRAVAFYFPESTSKVEVSLKTENVLIGRNILIAGNTPFSCPPGSA